MKLWIETRSNTHGCAIALSSRARAGAIDVWEHPAEEVCVRHRQQTGVEEHLREQERDDEQQLQQKDWEERASGRGVSEASPAGSMVWSPRTDIGSGTCGA